MLELAQKFIARTTDDVACMREALARLDAIPGGDDGSVLAQIQQLAHRACGTGGTLGLCALSDAAAALERFVEACPAGAVADAAMRAEIAARIDAMAVHL